MNLAISELSIQDKELYFALYGSEQVMQFLAEYLPEKLTEESYFGFLNSNGFSRGRVIKKITCNAENAGIITATKSLKNDNWDLGMLLLEKYQNKGIGTDIMLLLMEYLQSNYAISRFSGTIPHANKPCLSMVESLGFSKIKESEQFSHWLYCLDRS